MTIKEENKEDTISVRTEEERAKFWLNYGAKLAWRHHNGCVRPEDELIEDILDMSLSSAEWTILPLSNEEILNAIIQNISEEELMMIYQAHWAKEKEASLS